MSDYHCAAERENDVHPQAGEKCEKPHETALNLIATQRYSEAVELLDQAIASSPRDAASFYARAVANLSMNNYRKAGSDFLRVIVLDPGHVDAYRYLGFVQHTLGKDEAARKTIEKGLAIDPSCADLYCVLGDVHLDLCEFEQAKQAFDKALELAPENAEPHCKIAMYYLSKGDMKSLKREYEVLKMLDAPMAEQIGSLFFS